MANLIQIKRSTDTATPPSLANGELAFTSNGDVLFIGDEGNVLAIAGARNPGTLTANQALVANSSSAIDAVIVANLVPTKLYANGSHGTAGQALLSNGSAVYWGTGTAGSNTQVQFNDSGVSNGSASFTFDKVSETLTVSNTISVGNSTVNTVLNSTSLSVGPNVSLSTSSLSIGNSSVNTFINSSTISVSSITGISPNIVVDLQGDVTGTANTTLTNLGNGTITITTTIAANSVALGADTTGDYVANVTAGSGLSGSASGEGSTPTLAVVANNGLASNSTGVFVVAGNGVASNGTGVHVVAGTGVTSNATGVHIGQAVGTSDSVTFQDLTTNGNTVLGSGTMDVVSFNASVNTNILPAANATYGLGNNTLRWLEVHAANVHSEFGYFDKDVTISGNLVVSGNLVTVNVSTLSITDSLIQLASNNTLSDSLDIGFFGSYQVSGGDHEHTGLFRDASDDKYKLFKGLTASPTTTVDTSNNTYQTATLLAYLDSGGLTTNSTSVSLAANSTIAVSITANSLSLSTPLAGNSGGTGLSSYTAEDILVANSSNGFRKLALGATGYVLQSNGTSVVYATLDGGTF